MKYKCFWEKEDVKGGLIVHNQVGDDPDVFMIIQRGFASKGEPEFCLINVATGETVQAYFMPRAALAEYLTENNFEPAGGNVALQQGNQHEAA